MKRRRAAVHCSPARCLSTTAPAVIVNAAAMARAIRRPVLSDLAEPSGVPTPPNENIWNVRIP